MQKLNAIDAISPALQRTREVLFGPRRFGLFLKITLVATLAALGDGLNLNFGNHGHHAAPANLPANAAAIMAAFAGVAVILAVVFTIIGLILFFLGNRMQFVLFDMVLTRRTEVGPAWRAYGNRTWRWIGTKIVVYVACIVAMILCAFPLVIRLFRAQRDAPTHNVHALFAGLMGPIVSLFVIGVIFFIISAILHDFVLPAVALEDARVIATIGRVWSLLKAEPGELSLYLLLRLVIVIPIIVAFVIVIVIVAIALGLLLLLIGVVLALLCKAMGAAGAILLGILVVGEVIVFFLGMLFAYIACIGAYMVFQQAWSIFFLSGRYTLLGQLLAPSLTPVTPQYAYGGYTPAPTAPAPPAHTAYPPTNWTTAEYHAPADTMAATVGAFGEGSGTSGVEPPTEPTPHMPPTDEPEV